MGWQEILTIVLVWELLKRLLIKYKKTGYGNKE